MSDTALTDRQKAILKMVIDEYISTAEPISSGYLTKKYKLNVSAATIRNEMAVLIRRGYLDQPHTSAGRVPTPAGYRLYIRELMGNTSLPVLKEVAMKQNVWSNRYDPHSLLRSASSALASATNLLSLVSLNDGSLYYSGVVNILDYIEFFDIEVSRAVLNMLDSYENSLYTFLEKRNTSDTCVIMGDEFERSSLYPVSVVAKSFVSGGKKGHVCVIGPARMKYQEVIPAVDYMAHILEELGVTW
ncbi:MAG TPA: hypothetical protein ENJ78_01315 [candidate division WWE3 bacterium]|uniref:Heat-inducible transcription repressor HrcA n=1 Tax=candidate division WWE3 bacterium TaxID=2053526 RepID=A0A7V5MHQ0_UNCKA|nr:hypothetical protein [candidate division WWE3 bacterium]